MLPTDGILVLAVIDEKNKDVVMTVIFKPFIETRQSIRNKTF